MKAFKLYKKKLQILILIFKNGTNYFQFYLIAYLYYTVPKLLKYVVTLIQRK